MRGKRLEDKKHAVGRMNTGVRCGPPSPPASPAVHAGPGLSLTTWGSTPEDHGAWRSGCVPAERVSARAHTHIHPGNRKCLAGLSVLLCVCAESPRRVCGQPLSVSLAPAGGLTPRVCRRAHHRVESQNSGGSLRQGAPSGFLHGGRGGARGSPGGRIWGQSPRSSQSLRLQSRSSRRATLSFSDSLSWWITWGRNAERGASDTAQE